MAEVVLHGSTIKTATDFYDQFFAATEGLMADYGGRNLDAIVDDLRDRTEPPAIRWVDSRDSAASSSGWFHRICSALRNDQSAQLVTLILE